MCIRNSYYTCYKRNPSFIPSIEFHHENSTHQNKDANKKVVVKRQLYNEVNKIVSLLIVTFFIYEFIVPLVTFDPLFLTKMQIKK